MPKHKAKISILKPSTNMNPELKRTMHSCVDAVMRDKNPCVGYAFVSSHGEGSFHAYFQCPPHTSSMDIPEMTKARLAAKIIANLEET